jgi:serine/threonine protein phosphatase PrpC
MCGWDDDDVLQEEQRIVAHGGLVRALTAAEGTELMPARVFAADMYAVGEYSPGIAMSRSLGDALATELGVVATPEYMQHPLCASDRFVILATDGLWEVYTAQGTTLQGPVAGRRNNAF